MDTDLIRRVNKLQDIFNQIGGETVDLPQIVVVGSQSSGKSSVLETFVGHDFLPRGTGIVTRRPLILQLVNISIADTSSDEASSSNQTQTEWAEFLHTGEQRFYNFNEIRAEIENETVRLAGKEKGIHPNPINLKVYSPNVVNLTLVDLPGLTKNPIGDQPRDIERRIRELVESYISKPNCIILAVSPANVDLANSDSLKLARQVDPRCTRTIGVLTKLDLMDPGTNALDILQGRGGYPLKLGFIGIVNRSQKDIDDRKKMTDAIKDEQAFFRNHPVYRTIAYKSGSSHLARTLNSVLLSHIRERLPDMKARLNTLIGQTQQELREFGDPTFMGDVHRGSLVLKLMTQFATDFVASIDGTSPSTSTKELGGGARIYYIYDETFGQALDSINPTDNLTNQDIMTAIRNAKGPRPRLFAPEVAFDLLIKPQIKLLELPALRCVHLVYEELMKICHNCTSTELQRYPKLHARIIEVVSDLLRERLGPTSEYVESLIAIQVSYINTNHPDFVRNTTTSSHLSTATITNRTETTTVHESVSNLSSPHYGQGESPNNARKLTEGGKGEYNDSSSHVAESRETSDDIGYLLHPGSSHNNQYSAQRPRSEIDQRSSPGNTAHPRYSSDSVVSTKKEPHVNGTQINGAPKTATATDAFMQYFLGGAATNTNVNRTHAPLVPARDGRAAAFDMKSLERHLEAVPGDHEGMSERDQMETTFMRTLIVSYFAIVRQSIQDLVPKAIMHLLVNFSREVVQNRLVSALFKENLFEELLYEDENLTAERNRVKTLLDAYKEAFKTLTDVM